MSKTLQLDFEYEHDYTLIGIHSSLEDFRMAFFLNKSLGLKLKRCKEDLDFEINNCSFSFFDYKDVNSMIYWSLITNKYVKTEEIHNNNSNLFNDESKTTYLISEKKQVDFFIKIGGQINQTELHSILVKINKTKKVITSYSINPYDLSSKDYLIF